MEVSMPFYVFQISPGAGWTFRLEDDSGTAFCQSPDAYPTQQLCFDAVARVRADAAGADVLVQLPGQEPVAAE
jgi:hypothetical protein